MSSLNKFPLHLLCTKVELPWYQRSNRTESWRRRLCNFWDWFSELPRWPDLFPDCAEHAQEGSEVETGFGCIRIGCSGSGRFWVAGDGPGRDSGFLFRGTCQQQWSPRHWEYLIRVSEFQVSARCSACSTWFLSSVRTFETLFSDVDPPS